MSPITSLRKLLKDRLHRNKGRKTNQEMKGLRQERAQKSPEATEGRFQYESRHQAEQSCRFGQGEKLRRNFSVRTELLHLNIYEGLRAALSTVSEDGMFCMCTAQHE